MSEKAFDGAWDNAEVSTAEHDELVLRLLDASVVNSIVSTRIKQKEGTRVVVKNTLSEYVVGGSFIHGYVDVIYDLRRYSVTKKIHTCVYREDIKPCKKGDDGSCMLNGGEDVWETEVGNHFMCFEVKPRVTNFGSLLRQINKYKANINTGNSWYVYTKECPENIKKALEGQGIEVIIHKP